MPPPVTIDSHISFDADAVFRELDGEAVVLSHRTGLYFGLNEVGTRVWQLIEQHRDLRQVFDALRAEFEVGDDRLLESHNTPRAATRTGGITYARWAMVVNAFLPAIPFVHSGYELAEEYPINTGLDFSREQLRALPSEKLPLFSEYAFSWTRPETFAKLVRQVLIIRRRYAALVTRLDPASMLMLEDPNPDILAFARVATGH